MQCNIDQRGKMMRLMVGAILVLAWTGQLAGDWTWFVGGAALVGGLFLIFEALAGWCVLRAMGIRTPI